MGRGLFLTAMNREFPLPRAAAAVPSAPNGRGSEMADARVILPPNAPGMRIGLFGGTFDPAHAAHRAACLLAMNRIGLDRVWWLVTPGNPLKDTSRLAPLAERVAAARALAHHPRIDVTDLEAGWAPPIPTRRSLIWSGAARGVHFVWIMGADNLRSFHRWQRWRDIAELVPIAVVDRLGPSLYATAGVAGQALARSASPNRRQGRCRNERRRPGFICTASNRRCPRRRYGRHGPCTIGECESPVKRCNM